MQDVESIQYTCTIFKNFINVTRHEIFGPNDVIWTQDQVAISANQMLEI